MAKKVSAPPTSTEVKQEEKSKRILDHLAASARARAKKMGMTIVLTLYQFANNGLISGRQGGNVMMRNGRARKMTVPALVQNGFTQAQRASLGSLSSAWNSLTDAQRLTWVNARGFFRSNRFGVSEEISGKTLFVALNQNNFNTGRPVLTSAPLPSDVPGITSLSFVVDDSANTFVLTFAPTPTDADVNHLIFATTQMSAGTYRPSKSAYRLIGVLAGSTATGEDINAEYVAKFGSPVAGGKIFIKLIPVDRNTGQAGPAIVASSIVVA